MLVSAQPPAPPSGPNKSLLSCSRSEFGFADCLASRVAEQGFVANFRKVTECSGSGLIFLRHPPKLVLAKRSDGEPAPLSPCDCVSVQRSRSVRSIYEPEQLSSKLQKPQETLKSETERLQHKIDSALAGIKIMETRSGSRRAH
jgi:hypothetical protein